MLDACGKELQGVDAMASQETQVAQYQAAMHHAWVARQTALERESQPAPPICISDSPAKKPCRQPSYDTLCEDAQRPSSQGFGEKMNSPASSQDIAALAATNEVPGQAKQPETDDFPDTLLSSQPQQPAAMSASGADMDAVYIGSALTEQLLPENKKPKLSEEMLQCMKEMEDLTSLATQLYPIALSDASTDVPEGGTTPRGSDTESVAAGQTDTEPNETRAMQMYAEQHSMKREDVSINNTGSLF